MLSDEKIASLSNAEFRCFIGLLLLADDYGNARSSPNYVTGQIFWGSPEPVDSREILAKLSRVSLIQQYEVNSQMYLHICGWDKHQKVDHRGRALIPFPPNSREILASPREILSNDPGSGTLDPGVRSSSPPENSVELATLPNDATGEPISADLADVLAHYCLFHPKAKPGAKEKRLVRDRLRERYSADDLKKAISGYHISPFHCGVNERNTTFLSLSLILRDSSHVQKGIELSEKGTPSAISEKGLRAKFAVESFLSRGKAKL